MGFDTGYKVEDGAGCQAALADGAVREDAEVLVILAEVEKDAGGSGEVGCDEDWDVWLFCYCL